MFVNISIFCNTEDKLVNIVTYLVLCARLALLQALDSIFPCTHDDL